MGAGCDVLWLNEAIHIPNSFFDQSEMRCREFWFMDYNPEASEHWIYEKVIPRPNVAYLKTTFIDNPFCPPAQRRKILSYDPNNPENVANGTADPYMWDVYGRGIKAEKKGRIFPTLFRYSQLPNGADFLGYGIDFGFSEDPAVCVKLWRSDNDLYIQQLVHQTGLTDDELAKTLWAYGYEEGEDVVCDAAEPKAIHILKRNGIRAWRCYKGKDSVEAGIKLLKSMNLYIHQSSHKVYKDFENYCWKIDPLTDKPLNVPERAYKHSVDATVYPSVRFIQNVRAE